MQYIISAEIGKLFQFQVSEEVLKELGMVMNRFMAAHIEKKMNSLEMLDE
jgi:DNA repair protein RecO (recombination protein O)